MPLTRVEFIKKYYPFVQSITKGTGVFPETLLGQAILESQGKVNGTYYPGESGLAKNYNNYFGIKASKGWTGKVVNLNTREVFGGKDVIIKDGFRVYTTPNDSMKDYVLFLKNNPRYATALKAKTYQDQIKEIAKAGYATDPNYTKIVTSVADTIKSAGTTAVKTVKNNPGKTILVFAVISLLVYGYATK